MGSLLLDLLPPDDLAELRIHSEEVGFRHGAFIELPGHPVQHAYFIASGFVSILLEVGVRVTEVGLVGREGMIGLPAALGAGIEGYRASVRSDLKAYRIEIAKLKELMLSRRAMGAILLRFMQAGVAQITYTAFSNAHLTVAQRLSRWLLMAHDRSESDAIIVTHLALSEALGVRRSGITHALHELEARELIATAHRTIRIAARAGLVEAACGAYGPAERAYKQLLGVGISRA